MLRTIHLPEIRLAAACLALAALCLAVPASAGEIVNGCGGASGIDPVESCTAVIASDAEPTRRVAAYVNRGVAHAARGDLDLAIADYDAAVALNPDLAEAFFDRGNAYRLRYQHARSMAGDNADNDGPSDQHRAIADYSRALELRPDLAAAYVNRAIVWYEQGEFERAIVDCDKAIRLAPTLAEAWNNRSLAWYRSGHYEKAKADFDQTIKLEQFYGNAMIMRPVADIEMAIPTV